MRTLNLFVLVTTLILNACTSSKETNGKILVKDNGEARLGKSALYLTIPQDLEIYQEHGKEGYAAYNIFSKEMRNDVKGEMVIWSGRSILYASDEPKEKIDSITNKILDKEIVWTIYKTAEGLYASSKNENAFFIWAKERKDVDELIAVFATLKKK